MTAPLQYTVRHFDRPFHDELRLNTLVEATAQTGFGQVSLSVRMVWNLVSHRDGNRFHLCDSVVLILPTRSRMLHRAYVEQFGGAFRIFRKLDGWVYLLDNRWRKVGTGIANNDPNEDLDAAVDRLKEFLDVQLQELLSRV